jgi:hypothetical protein
MQTLPERVNVDGRWCYVARWSKDGHTPRIERAGGRCYFGRFGDDGPHLLCGHPNCGALGTEWARGRFGCSHLRVRRSFTRDGDGIWRVSAHVADRLRDGKTPHGRRRDVADRLTQRFPGHVFLAERDRCVRDGDLIACPRCKHVNLVEFAALDLHPWTCPDAQ